MRKIIHLLSVLAVAVTSALPFASPALAAVAPDAPLAPTVSTVTATSITVAWLAPVYAGDSAITRYDVFRDGVKIAPTTSRQYMFGSLAGSTTYSFTVQACNITGCSASSPAVTATTNPAAATLLTTKPAAGELTLSWTANGGTDAVDSVWYRPSTTSTFTEWTPGVADTSGTTITGLTNGTSYSLKVRTSASPAIWTESPPVIATPTDVPSVVVLSYTNLTMTSLTLNWVAKTANGAKPNTYEVYRDGVKMFNVTTLYANVTGLTTLQRYSFTVKACNLSGCSALSDPLEITMPPSPPSRLLGTAAAYKATLSWTASPGGLPHAVQYKLASATAWTEFTPGVDDVSPLDVTGLIGGSSYNFRVIVTAPDGTISPSLTVTLTPFGVPSVPINLRQRLSSATGASVAWTAPFNGGTPITSYKVFRDGVLVASPGATTTTVALSALALGTKYDVTVEACNIVGCSDDTPVTATYTLPAAPTGLTADAFPTAATLTWDPATTPAAPSHKIFYRKAGTTAFTEHTTGVDDLSGTTVSGLSVVTSYETFIRAYYPNGLITAFVDSPTTTFSTPYFMQPSSPLNVVATAQAGAAKVTWAVPAQTGYSPITDYLVEYTTDAGATWTAVTRAASTVLTLTLPALTVGTPYAFRVTAKNIAGSSDPSATSNTATPYALPDAPHTVTAAPGNLQTVVSWVAPTNDGSAAITDYTVRYSTNGGVAWTTVNDGVSTATTATVTALSNGTSYVFQVAATNAAGTGAFSASSAASTPLAPPDAPKNVTGTPFDTSVKLAWTVPSATGGTPLTDYLVQFSDDAGATWTSFADGTSTLTSATVTGLTNGTPYVFRVAAVTSFSDGEYSTASAAVTPRTTPDAPTTVTGVPGNLSATISWDAPVQTGGDAISDYIVSFSSNSGGTWRVASKPLPSPATTAVITGLSNGLNYIFRVTAVNGAGTGAASGNSAQVTPRTVPAIPTSLTAVPGDAVVALSWRVPTSTGGSPITDYVIQYSDPDTIAWATFQDGISTALTASVTGIPARRSYIFRVQAVNAAGESGYTAATSTAFFGSFATAPTAVVTTPAASSIALTWVVPSDDGGSAILDYVVQHSTNGGTTWVTFADGVSTNLAATVTGLTNGTAYMLRVAAITGLGTGQFSDITAPVTPRSAATAPSGVAGTSLDGSVALRWTAPSSTGGSAVTDYQILYSSSAGLTWVEFAHPASAATSINVDGLANGTSYIFKVAAINAAGLSASSSNSGIVVPRALADAPTDLTATPGNARATVTWTAPVNTGGATITDYAVQYSSNAGTTWTTFVHSASAVPSISVTGLVNGTSYIFRAATVNSVGTGAYSTMSGSVTPRTIPGLPTAVAGTAGNALVTLTWAAPVVTGGAAVADYAVQYSSDSGATWTTFAHAPSPATTIDVTGLRNGTAHVFRLASVNDAGSSAYTVKSAAVTPRTTPAAPTGLTTTAGPGTVELAWAAPADNGGAVLTDYVIQTSSDAGTTWVTVADGVATTVKYVIPNLTNGTSYVLRAAAVNAAGTGDFSSATAPVTPVGPPAAPTDFVATAGNATVTLSWTAPTDDGGSAITDYDVNLSSNAGVTWVPAPRPVSTATTFTMIGLTNGVGYLFRVAATNAVGTGPRVMSPTTTPKTIPGTPTAPTGTPADASVLLTWTAPPLGGSPITDYTVQVSNDSGATWVTFDDGISAAASTVVTGLTNGTPYVFRFSGTNIVGTGAYSPQSASVIPRTTPDAPLNLSGVAGAGAVSLTWDPAVSGGDAVTDYIIQATSNTGTTWTTFSDGVSAATTAAVTSLTPNTTYNFRVAAVNLAGTGAYSAMSAALTPSSVLDPPTALACTSAPASVLLSWTAPALTGGSSVLDYAVQHSSNGGTTWVTFSDGVRTATTATVTGLTNGTTYRFRVATTNTLGTGAYTSDVVECMPLTVPGLATAVAAVWGDAQASLTWSAPAFNGGTPVTDYAVQFSANGGTTWTTFTDAVSTTRSTLVTGLTNNTSHIFRIAAVNAIGTGSYSVASVAVTPRPAPDEPTVVAGTAANASVALVWTAPASVATAAITDYIVQFSTDAGTTWSTFADGTSTALSATVTGLTNGTPYVFRAAGVNQSGTGTFSTPSASVTPRTVPDAPTTVAGTPNSTSVSLTWAAPAFNGGSVITDYAVQFSSNSGSTWTTFADGISTTLATTVTGLTNGTTYVFRIAAINVAGTGASSAQSASVTPRTVPDAPTAVVGTPSSNTVTLAWALPVFNGGAAITDYAVQFSSDSGATWTSFADGTSTTRTATVTGLTNGTPYVFQVAAINQAGTGAYSASSSSVTPRTVADAPTAVAGTFGNTTVALTWAAPVFNGGTPLTDYAIQRSSDGGTTWTTFADGTSTALNATVTGLTNGTSYVFRVAAVNVAGTGAYSSASAAVVPATMPSAPASVAVTPANTTVALTWPAPVSSGGAAVTDYVVQFSSNAGSTWTTFADGTSAALAATVTGLTNGVPYIFRVAAINVAGIGAYSTSSSSATPRTVADAPTVVVGTFGNTTVALTWVVPVFNGGAAITDYTVQRSSDGGTTWVTFADGTSTSLAATVTGLTNGTSYVFRVAAVNVAGTSAYSAQSAAVIPATTPSVPTAVVGTFGNTLVSLVWAAPASTGGSAITDYTVQYSSNSGSTWTTFPDSAGTALAATVTGLTNGTSYIFRVSATNIAGTGSYSSNSSPVTPASPPGVPDPSTAVTGVADNTTVTLSWAAPLSDGGSVVSDYAVQFSSNGGSTWSTFADGTSATPSATVTGLTNGTPYVFRIAAINLAGTGAYSPQSSSVTPRTVPNAPTAVAGTFGNTTAALTWAAPVFNGGSAITDYTIQSSTDSGATWTTFGDAVSTSLAATVTGLTNGTSYVFRVAAVNVAGTGAYSASSSAVTPATTPSAPSSAAGTPDNTSVALTWALPVSTGGAAISDYAVQFSSNAGSTWTTFADGTSTALAATVTGLTNGTSYIFRIAAINVAGTGAYSASSSPVIPRTIPDAPTTVAGAAGNTTVALTWVAPASNGGSAVTDYTVQYSSDSGSTWTPFSDGISTALSATVTGLTNGTSYVFRVAAINVAGTGAYSITSPSATSRTTPDAPTAVGGTAGNTTVALTWAAPGFNGGSAITDYAIQYSSNSGSTWTTFADGTSAALAASITGLANGTSYVFRVAAVNVAGTGTYSTTSAPVVPVAPPDAPTAVVGTPANTSVVLSWSAAFNGGTAITDYVVQHSTNGGSTWTTFADGTSTALTATVTGLMNGMSYVFRVAAVNVVGTGAYSTQSATVVPRTVADAPTAVVSTPNSTSVALTWAAPVSNGGTAITDYTVEFSSDSGSTWTVFADGISIAPTATVTGLANGTPYIFRVAAVNAAGTGAYSTQSSPVTPRTTPDAPTTPGVTAGTGQVTLTWTAPASTGGASITDYVIQYSSNSGSTWSTFADGTSTATTVTVTGLTNGTSYVFRLAAVNAAGTGTYSTQSATAMPTGPPFSVSPPGGTAGNGNVALAWLTPASNGGSAITDYVVQFSSNSGSTWTTFADGISTAVSATVSGLTNATSYVFRVAAVNALGTASYSSASASFVPFTVPGAPAISGASADTANTTLTITAPATNGRAIDGYTATCTSSNGGTARSGTTTTLSVVVYSLTAGYNYSCSVTATNAAGTGTASPAKTLTAAQGSTTTYSCPSGGSLSGTTCSVADSGWTVPTYGATPNCPGAWTGGTNGSALFADGVGGPYYGGWDGHCNTTIWYTYKSAGGTCWSSPSGAQNNGANKGVCSAGGLYKYVNMYSYGGNNVYWTCPSGGSLSGTTCTQPGYWANPAYTYTATGSTSYWWNGWTIT